MHARITLTALFIAGLIGLSACALNDKGHVTRQTIECANDFDFWLGDWDVRQRILKSDGSWLDFPATTSVTRRDGSCVITEHWSGRVQFFWEGMLTPEEIRGYSVRVRDPQSGQWSIYWMDSRAPRFDAPYVGSFLRDRGEFFRMIETPDGPRRARIVFSTARPEIVDWELAVSADQGVNWTPLWTMEMRRR